MPGRTIGCPSLETIKYETKKETNKGLKHYPPVLGKTATQWLGWSSKKNYRGGRRCLGVPCREEGLCELIHR